MPTRSEAFAGLSVALITPFRDGAGRPRGPAAAGRVSDRSRHDLPLPGGHHRRIAHAVARRTRAGDRRRGRGGRRADQGHGRHRLQQHRRGPAADEAGPPRRGADAALVVAPYYNKPTQEGFYQHFKALAEAVDIPICVYNIPGRTGKNIEPETIARMAELPNITMVKEATGSMDQASQIVGATEPDRAQRRRQPDAAADGHRRPRRDLGGGQHRAARHDRADPGLRDGRRAGSRLLHHKLFPLCRDMLGLATNPIPIKAAMKLLGRDTGELHADDAVDGGSRGPTSDHIDQVWPAWIPMMVECVK